MKVSWNWLKDFIDLEGLVPAEVADKLTMSGMEVEGVEAVGGLDGVVVGRIIEREPHEQSDHLSVCQVDAGLDEPLQIVCGAPNAAAGMVAPIAMIGARLGESFVIKKAKMRGVVSFGMLCSSTEIGLDDGVDGLMKLSDDLVPGTPIADALGLSDTVFDIGLTPNRPDGLSMRGVAREIAALYDRPWCEAASQREAAAPEGSIEDLISLTVEDTTGCPRYGCVALRGVKVGPAPEWMQQRLNAVGQRPVNNIVDVTNYVLLEQGQPLHAFDLARVRGGKIVVRRATKGETITSIDHTERALRTDDLVICDGQGPVAIAGVMGGAESEISDETTDVLIECANFEPSTVRRTSRRLGMHTDSSHRFERGVDITRIPDVLKRTVELLMLTQDELGVDATVVGGSLDAYPVKYEAPVIVMSLDMPSRILGLKIGADTVVATLERLGLGVTREGSSIHATVPAYRPDLERPIDLVEEVGRLVGYNEIPATPLEGELGLLPIERDDDAPHEQPTQPVLSTLRVDAEEGLRDCLAGLGYSEAVNWAMIAPESDALFVPEDAAPGLVLRNPLGADRSALRRSLMPGLLDSLRHNVSRGTRDVRLFEVGHTFPGGEIQVENPEPQHLALVATGEIDGHWSGSGRPVDGFDLVGAVQQAAASVGASVQVATGNAPSWIHPAEHAVIRLGRKTIGWVGRIHPSVSEAWEMEAPVYAAELDAGVLLAREPNVPQYSEIARTPTSQRDLALVVPETVQYDEMERALKQFRHKFLESVTLFDVYTGPGLEAGTKSIALRARYRDISGTLTDKAIEKVHGKLLGHLGRMVGATLRG